MFQTFIFAIIFTSKVLFQLLSNAVSSQSDEVNLAVHSLAVAVNLWLQQPQKALHHVEQLEKVCHFQVALNDHSNVASNHRFTLIASY